jgi:hypothetical protein
MGDGSMLCVNVNSRPRAGVNWGIGHKTANYILAALYIFLCIVGHFIIHRFLNQMVEH